MVIHTASPSFCTSLMRFIRRCSQMREFFFSRLPVCYIDVANGAEPSAQKEEHDATIRIQGNGAYAQQYDGATTIHVRGNSTKGYPKKPWKIKLDKKTDVFGLGGGGEGICIAFYCRKDLRKLEKFMVNDASVRFLFVGEQEQYDKAHRIFALCPTRSVSSSQRAALRGMQG